jgi:endonuclease G
MTYSALMPRPASLPYGRFAAAMPNNNAVGDGKWADFRISIDQIEQRTGYDLLSNLPSDVQHSIEAGTDQVVVQSAYLGNQPQW